MVESICKEIDIRSKYLITKQLQTIYFGGGTPSLVNTINLNRILSRIKEYYQFDNSAEITLEANPDDIDPTKLEAWKKLGINRLSIGIQSFRDQDLKLMNRAHNSTEALNCVSLAKLAGFENITIDLIYGIPGLTINAWKDNIEKALALDVPHVSAYCLTIEPNTVFGHWYKKGKLIEEPDEITEEQFNILIHELECAGFDHYEISNFGMPGFLSKHNSNYWKGIPYLGLGPSAHSFNSRSRQWNVSNNQKYMNAIQNEETHYQKEEITHAMAYNEYILTSLRTKWGIDPVFIKNKFGFDITQKFSAEFKKHRLHLMKEQGRFKLNTKGMILADNIASDLFIA